MNEAWFEAAEQGRTDLLAELLDAGAEVDAFDRYGTTALAGAVFGGHADTVELLLARGADPNAARWEGHTAVTYAALHARGWVISAGRLYRVRTPDARLLSRLVEAGGRVGLREAILLQDVGLARNVCDHDRALDVNDEARFGMHETFLMLAASVGPPEMVAFLLDRGADIEGTDDLGHTALLRAAEVGLVDVVGLLLDRGADIDSGWPGGSALNLAEYYGRESVESLLRARGAKASVGFRYDLLS
jgi:ankyrin repeat protein